MPKNTDNGKKQNKTKKQNYTSSFVLKICRNRFHV